MTSTIRPNVFLVGAPKAGTSAMSNYLARHPQVGVCRPKEPNFFCRDFDLPKPRSEAAYLDLFPSSEDFTHYLDASVHYMQSGVAASEIAKYAPDARIIMMLRSPVDAMYSWHGQLLFNCNENITDFVEALDAEPDRRAGRRLPPSETSRRCPNILFYRDVMDYAAQIERFYDSFDRRQVHIISYDDFKADTAASYRQLLEFLDLDDFAPDFKVMNPAQQRRSPQLHSFLKRTFGPTARAVLPLRVRLDIIKKIDRLNSKVQKREPLAEAVKERLRAECLPRVVRLSEVTGRDFTHWCS